jgi:lipopolysaccharide export system permease protein
MKVLYRYILKSFVGPLALTLAIALFILLMQFLWKYIDDLVGKGLSAYVIAKLIVLATVTLVPMALPLAILLASIMTFGNLAENHELVCMKSAGMSLPRILSPLIMLIFFISVSAFFFANNLMPLVNLKMGSLLYDIRSAKPALNIRQDIFYNGIDGFSMRIGQKDQDQETIRNITIYDHTGNDGNTKVTLAKSGKMKMSADKHYLVLTLFNGNHYEDIFQNGRTTPTHPMLLNSFEKEDLYMDLSSFKFSRTNEELFKNNYDMLNLKQLSTTADSMQRQLDSNKVQFYKQISQTYFHYQPNNRRGGVPADLNERNNVLDVAENIARNARQYASSTKQEFHDYQDNIQRRWIEWHRKFTFSFACLILFFIGAPLGAIIKKGGLGLPVVVSALFFILFYVLSITGEKFCREQITAVFVGMWMPSAILLPIGVFFTYKATKDSALFDGSAYVRFFQRLANAVSWKRGGLPTSDKKD